MRRHLAARLPPASALRRRLWWMPLNLANPAWVGAEPDLSVHVVELKLPRDAASHGDARALMEAQASLLHPQLLDSSKPL